MNMAVLFGIGLALMVVTFLMLIFLKSKKGIGASILVFLIGLVLMMVSASALKIHP